VGAKLNIFAIYTLEDIAVMHQTEQLLKSSGKNANFSIWKDDPIKPGQQWRPQIESRVQEADIFLFFISNVFMHSEFVKQLEFKLIIDQFKGGSTKVIPILIDDCPWGIAFEADEYTFSFKELQVLPGQEKPLKDWDSQKDAYEEIIAGIKSQVPNLFRPDVVRRQKPEEQTELSFKEEEKSNNNVEEERGTEEEARARIKVEEEKRRLEEEEVKRKAQEKRRQEEESKQSAEAQRLQKEAEAVRLAGEEHKRREELEAKRIAEKELRAPQKPEQQNQVVEPHEELINRKRKFFKVGVAAALIILGVWVFSLFNNGSEEKPQNDSEVTSEEIMNSEVSEKPEIEKVSDPPAITELKIGDFHDGGMVFAVDANSKNGMIVYLEDAGPMTWEDAVQIHEQLGEGWRLPTLDELLILYKTVGQGAENTAEFSNGLYWSATDYDQYQARLLRFRDANTSYHYNKVAPHRKYRVRAIRDFRQ